MAKKPKTNPALDHDGDGQPGGSAPPVVVLLAAWPRSEAETFAAGRVIRLQAILAEQLVAGSTARHATDRDIAVAGIALIDLT